MPGPPATAERACAAPCALGTAPGHASPRYPHDPPVPLTLACTCWPGRCARQPPGWRWPPRASATRATQSCRPEAAPSRPPSRQTAGGVGWLEGGVSERDQVPHARPTIARVQQEHAPPQPPAARLRLVLGLEPLLLLQQALGLGERSLPALLALPARANKGAAEQARRYARSASVPPLPPTHLMRSSACGSSALAALPCSNKHQHACAYEVKRPHTRARTHTLHAPAACRAWQTLAHLPAGPPCREAGG